MSLMSKKENEKPEISNLFLWENFSNLLNIIQTKPHNYNVSRECMKTLSVSSTICYL